MRTYCIQDLTWNPSTARAQGIAHRSPFFDCGHCGRCPHTDIYACSHSFVQPGVQYSACGWSENRDSCAPLGSDILTPSLNEPTAGPDTPDETDTHIITLSLLSRWWICAWTMFISYILGYTIACCVSQHRIKERIECIMN